MVDESSSPVWTDSAGRLTNAQGRVNELALKIMLEQLDLGEAADVDIIIVDRATGDDYRITSIEIEGNFIEIRIDVPEHT